MKYLIRKFTVFACMLLISCGGGGGVDSGGNACNAFGARRLPNAEKVFGGETCSQKTKTPVVAILTSINGQRQGVCSGTLISVDDVLTSAHCISDRRIDAVDVVITGPDGEVIPARRGVMHPYYNGLTGSPYDVAIVNLSRLPNPQVGPVPILLSSLTQAGQDFSTFGYGVNDKHAIGDLKSVELKIAGFDRLGNIIATLKDNNASVCSGDSGGPIIQVINGTPSLVGVNSFIRAGGCVTNAADISGFLDVQYDDILDFIFHEVPDASAN